MLIASKNRWSVCSSTCDTSQCDITKLHTSPTLSPGNRLGHISQIILPPPTPHEGGWGWDPLFRFLLG